MPININSESFNIECEAWISFRKKVTLTAFPFEVQFYMAIIFCDSWVKVTSEHLLLTALWLFELFEGLTLSTRNTQYSLHFQCWISGVFNTWLIQAKKKITVVRSWATDKMTTIFTQNGQSCHFVHLLSL
jgi:hypothetical protein